MFGPMTEVTIRPGGGCLVLLPWHRTRSSFSSQQIIGEGKRKDCRQETVVAVVGCSKFDLPYSGELPSCVSACG